MRWLTPPERLIARLRWLFLLVALANLATVLPLITSSTRLDSGVRLLAVGAGACLGALWLIGYHRHRFGLVTDVASACALLVIAVPLVSVEHALGLHASAIVHRSMYRRDRRSGLPAVLQAMAFLGSGLLRSGDLVTASIDIDLVVQAGLLAFAGAVLSHVVSVLEEHERAADRAKILAQAGSSLITTSDPAEIAEVGLEGAREILADHPARGFGVALTEGSSLVVSAADEVGPTPGAARAIRSLAGPVREALTGTGPFVTAQPLFGEAVQGADQWLVVPLVSHGVLRGVLTLVAPDCGEETCRCDDGLTALGGQLALALEGAVLDRDLRASETRFRSLVQHSSDVVTVLDSAGEICYLSPAATRVMGHEATTLNGRLDAIVHPEDLGAWNQFLHRLVVEADAGLLHCRLHHGDGGWLHAEVHGANLLEEPSVAGLVLNIRDVSDRRALEADLRNQAFHDQLTGLANRARFLDLLAGALADERRRDRITVLFIDLDGFKAVNDRLGHAGGDELLAAVARRLTSTLRETECVARLSGDEFGVFAEGDIGPVQAAELAQRLLDALAEPVEVQREEVRISASVGVAIGGTGVEDASDLLHRADLAMYTAKAAGKGRFTIFDAGSHRTSAGQRELASELESAVRNNEFEVRYQPIVALADGRVVSAEALVRWHHPRRGLLGPGTWIGLAEDEGLIGEVFDLVLHESCLQARTWRDSFGEAAAPGVAVNLSARQLCEPRLPDQVARALVEAGLSPSSLTIELSESVLHSDPHSAVNVLEQLKEIGVTIALDDFGTGYSSLTILRRLPLDVLKIDQTFVDGLGSRDTHGTLARATIDLGRRLGVRAVAEGIERVEQQLRLQEFGCDYGQGYLFSRPLVGPQFHELLIERLGRAGQRVDVV